MQMLLHELEHTVERRAIEGPLNVLVQFIKAFRASQFHFFRLLDHLQQLADFF